MSRTLPLLAALCLLCASPGLAHGSFVYVTNYGDGTVSQFRVRHDGTLTPLDPPAVRAHGLAHGLAADPTGRFLYALSARDFRRRDCVVSQFRVAPDGRLAALFPPRVLVPGTPVSIAVESSGRFAFAFSRQGSISQFRIEKDGRLSLLSVSSPTAMGSGSGRLVLGFDNPRHVLSESYTAGMLEVVFGGTSAFTIRGDGRPRPIPDTRTYHTTYQRTVSPPDSISLPPSGRYAYVPESLAGKQKSDPWRDVVAQYRTRPDGVLAPLSPRTVAAEAAGTRTDTRLIDPQGRFLYLVGSRASGTKAMARYCLAHARVHGDGTLGRFTYRTLNIQCPCVPPEGRQDTAPWAYSVSADEDAKSPGHLAGAFRVNRPA